MKRVNKSGLQHFANQQNVYKPNNEPPTRDVVICSECGNTWFEKIYLQQIDKNHNVILGQKPPSSNYDEGFWIMRCPKCGELYEPNLTYAGPQSDIRKQYDRFLDIMERDNVKNDTGEAL